MKKIIFILIGAIIISSNLLAQQNTLLDANFWKNGPDVAAVKAEIAKGNNPFEFNASAFDPTTLAINSGAPNSTIQYMLELPGADIRKLTHDSRIYLHWAAYKGNVEITQYLLNKGADMYHEDSHGATPVAFAAGSGQANTALYDAFFKAGLDAKRKYTGGASILLLCIPNDKDLVLTDYFVSKGLSLQASDDNGNTAFNYAARSGNIELLKKLLQKGVKYTDNALIMATQSSRRGASNGIELYQYLVDELKIKPGTINKDGQNVLHSLVRRQNQTDIVQYFMNKGVDINKADNEGNTVFINAAAGRDTALLALLLPRVKNINAANANGVTALAQALNYGSAGTVSLLLKNGAELNTTDKEGNNLLYYLVQSYRPMPGTVREGVPPQDDFGGKIQLLQQKGYNFVAPQKNGSTVYHLAIAKNDLDLLKKIAVFGADINALNKEGVTVLHKAALTAKDDVLLKYLLTQGAKKDIKTEFDETAYDLAKENNYLTQNKVSVDFLK